MGGLPIKASAGTIAKREGRVELVGFGDADMTNEKLAREQHSFVLACAETALLIYFFGAYELNLLY